jgi:hypothetical protein
MAAHRRVAQPPADDRHSRHPCGPVRDRVVQRGAGKQPAAGAADGPDENLADVVAGVGIDQPCAADKIRDRSATLPPDLQAETDLGDAGQHAPVEQQPGPPRHLVRLPVQEALGRVRLVTPTTLAVEPQSYGEQSARMSQEASPGQPTGRRDVLGVRRQTDWRSCNGFRAQQHPDHNVGTNAQVPGMQRRTGPDCAERLTCTFEPRRSWGVTADIVAVRLIIPGFGFEPHPPHRVHLRFPVGVSGADPSGLAPVGTRGHMGFDATPHVELLQ